MASCMWKWALGSGWYPQGTQPHGSMKIMTTRAGAQTREHGPPHGIGVSGRPLWCFAGGSGAKSRNAGSHFLFFLLLPFRTTRKSAHTACMLNSSRALPSPVPGPPTSEGTVTPGSGWVMWGFWGESIGERWRGCFCATSAFCEPRRV